MSHPMTDAERALWRLSLFSSKESGEISMLLFHLVAFAATILEDEPEMAERIYKKVTPRKGSLWEAIGDIHRIVGESLKTFKEQHGID